MAVTLDILRANVECWAVNTSDLIRDMPSEWSLYEGSRSNQSLHITKIHTAAHHLENVLQYTYSSLLAAVEGKEDVDIQRLKAIGLEIDAKLEVVKIRLQHWRSQIDRMVNISSARTDEMQAESVKRLTLLAAIFLPISLASSLLSMSVRATDLGDLWYDYFGLASISMFLVALIYLCLRVWDEARVIELRALALIGSVE
ncbi:hypothetical protein QQZ08_008004 [Neonectria magnoliae]|uniref:Uncharacterized protein n=1 Tax=Neonectria magnoliae TaxID=2732573 RepID=A0ABR1HWK5_9HYPO